MFTFTSYVEKFRVNNAGGGGVVVRGCDESDNLLVDVEHRFWSFLLNFAV